MDRKVSIVKCNIQSRVIFFTFELHAGLQALVEAASRALLSGGDRDGTLGAAQANVVLFVLYSPLEESLAALAGENAVVETRYFVSANGARTERR